MARYVMRVRSPKPPAEAFAYMADLRNLAQWDPGVKKAEQVEGDGAGGDAVFDVTVEGFAGDLTLRYRTISFEPPRGLVASAESNVLTSLDRITVEPDGDGSIVVYDAELTLNGAVGAADPGLDEIFDQVGGRAAKGLVRVLEGALIEEGSS